MFHKNICQEDISELTNWLADQFTPLKGKKVRKARERKRGKLASSSSLMRLNQGGSWKLGTQFTSHMGSNNSVICVYMFLSHMVTAVCLHVRNAKGVRSWTLPLFNHGLTRRYLLWIGMHILNLKNEFVDELNQKFVLRLPWRQEYHFEWRTAFSSQWQNQFRLIKEDSD